MIKKYIKTVTNSETGIVSLELPARIDWALEKFLASRGNDFKSMEWTVGAERHTLRVHTDKLDLLMATDGKGTLV